ncbi:MAG: methyltransferase family protein [Promethearchaeota archaeon]
MSYEKNKIKIKLNSIITSISSFIIPIFQYVPCTSIWFGIMSVPFLTYLEFFFHNPSILLYDINFLIGTHGFDLVLFGILFYIFSLMYQIVHRKQLIQTGPYKFVRHPQYLAFIIITFGFTVISFQTSPVFNINIGDLNSDMILLYIWIVEVTAYIVLAKVEEFALKARYGQEFLDYKSNVPFMIPFVKLKRYKIKKE